MNTPYRKERTMKTAPGNNPRRGLFDSLAQMAVLAGLFWAQGICAMPRSPVPPYPEQAPLYQESFDEDYFTGEINSELLIPGLGTLEESWSGYALQRTGDVIPFVVSAVASTGHTNVSCDTTMSFRSWLKPYWSSESVANGASPGATATLLELDAVSGGQSALAWSLQISADGNTIGLFAETGSGLQEVLQAQIAWTEGQSHLLALADSPQGTTLYVDGSVAAQGSGLPSIPISAGQLVIGSTLAGANTAGADFDEFYSFNRLLTASDVGLYYQMTSGFAALGPISAEEQAGWGQRRGGAEMASIHSPGNVYDPDNATPCSPGGPFYITNVSATLQTNGTTAVSFDIFGGTNGVFMDIFRTGSLNNSLVSNQWTWIGQGLTCNSYDFTNQPAGQAFYVLEPPTETMVVAWGDNAYGECDVPAGLTNATAVAAGWDFSLALRNDGTVLAWGDNSHDETNVPAGLSNVTAIAAGQYHGLALLANGAVTNWGYYASNDYYFYSVTNSAYVSPPPSSNVVAIVAGEEYDTALLSNGTAVVWGLIGSYDPVPINVTGAVAAVSCGADNSVVLLTNGTVVAWGDFDFYNLFGENDVPTNLSNAVAIATAPNYSLALRADGTVAAWGNKGDDFGETNVPPGLSNVVAIAAGCWQSLALQADGTVVQWGEFTNVPNGMTATKGISSGYEHNLAIRSGQLNPVILEGPAGQFAITGRSATFSVAASGFSPITYQWQFDGTNISGATNSSFTLTNAQSTNQGTYQAIVSDQFGSITSSPVTFELVLPPQITATTPPAAPGTNWINATSVSLTVAATNADQLHYPLSYQWSVNGTNVSGATHSYFNLQLGSGQYETATVTIANAAGSSNISWGTMLLAIPGMVEAWGNDSCGQCDRPASITNIAGIAASLFQSVAVTDSGTVVQWGQYWDGSPVTGTNVSLPPTNGVVAVAAGWGQAMALMTNGTVVAWGENGDEGLNVPPNLTNVTAIACGFDFSVALLTNGTVTAWGADLLDVTNVPPGLSNVIAISANTWHTLALQSNGTVVAWGFAGSGETDVPTGLSNVVAVAAGGFFSLALTSDGHVVAWGDNSYGQTNVPSGMSNVMAIAAGEDFGLALINDGTLVAWGDNSLGQTNIPSFSTNNPFKQIPAGFDPLTAYQEVFGIPGEEATEINVPIRLLAAGGFHSMAAIFSPLVQYLPVDVSRDLLLIYNTESPGNGSSNVCAYYVANRPMMNSANVLGIGCTTNEIISQSDFTNIFFPPIQNWLATNQTKRPSYAILFQDIPSRVGNATWNSSVQFELNQIGFAPWNLFVTSINMNGVGGTNDCIAYIDKLANMASNYSPGSLFISASAGGYGNTNWYFEVDDASSYFGGLLAEEAVTNADPTASVFVAHVPAHITLATNVAGYYSVGWDGGHSGGMATNGDVVFSGNSGWYIMASVDSFNGQRDAGGFQSGFVTWFASDAFGGTNYSNTPLGAVTHVEEPQGNVENCYTYYGNWALGKPFAFTAWFALYTTGTCFPCAVVGDPFVKK